MNLFYYSINLAKASFNTTFKGVFGSVFACRSIKELLKSILLENNFCIVKVFDENGCVNGCLRGKCRLDS